MRREPHLYEVSYSCVGGRLGDEGLRKATRFRRVKGTADGTNLESTRVCTDELLDLVAALEDEEGGHLSGIRVNTERGAK